MKIKLLLSLLALIIVIELSAQTSLIGTVTDQETGEPILFGNVKLFENEVFKMGVQTDFDGNYRFYPLEPGLYDIIISYVGYPDHWIEDVQVEAGKENLLDIHIKSGEHGEVIINDGYKKIKPDDTLTAAQIVPIPPRRAVGIVGHVQETGAEPEDEIIIRGSAAGSRIYYIDGVRVNLDLPSPAGIYLSQTTGQEDGWVTLFVDMEIKKVRLTDSSGKLVKRWRKLKPGEYPIRITGFVNGTYIVSHQVDGTTYESLLPVY
ncbi:MAG: carboxypeptidase regulatory-like domain-containing protein [Saprospiraceae bacterium]|nr:carboxypeptidase regulatory-like domain-containing protein [Saprospiraceae bacterium]